MDRFYYVSVIRDATKRAFLAGPYATHGDALAKVDEVRRKAIEADPWCAFDAFGTASAETKINTFFRIL